MANVAGVSAETAADQMTAIWNNFYDGSKSLEYYSDVMTALGAATASSTDEISEGVQKFASISNTIGLSYEYATSALATITATTREQASVVGNALRTIFSRIQGLNLGETLDDGTDLNKYSQALDKIGVKVLDGNDKLKDMDTLLNEIAAKWGTITKAQQIAVAETVGGVRQYTQLVALMDNWEFFQENLQTAMGSEGTLQNQADIFAESWEAANKRLKASWEDVYDSIINDDFFIKITNGLSEVVDFFSDVIDGIGGAKGALTGLGTIFTRVFQSQISESMKDTVFEFKRFFGMADKEAQKFKEEAGNLLLREEQDYGVPYSQQATRIKNETQRAYVSIAPKLTEEERKIAEQYFDRQEAVIASVKTMDEQLNRQKNLNEQLRREVDLRDDIVEQQKEILRFTDIKGAPDHVSGEELYGQISFIQQQILSAPIEGPETQPRNITTALKQLFSENSVTRSNYITAFGEDENFLQSFQALAEQIQQNGYKASQKDFLEITERLKEIITHFNKTIVVNEGFSQDNVDEVNSLIDTLENLSFSDSFFKNVGLPTFEASDIESIKRYTFALENLEESALNTFDAGQELVTVLKTLHELLTSKTPVNSEDIDKAFQAVIEAQKKASSEIGQVIANTQKDIGEVAKSTSTETRNRINKLAQDAAEGGAIAGQQAAELEKRLQVLSDSSKEFSKLGQDTKASWSDVGTQLMNVSFNVTNLITNFENLQKVMSGKEDANAIEFISMILSSGLSLGSSIKGFADLGKSIGEVGGSLASSSGWAGKFFSMMSKGGLKAAGVIALIVATIAAISFGIKQLVDKMHAEEIAVKQVEEAVRNLGEAANEAASKSKDLHSTFDGYKDLVKTLNDCTKGTKAWQDALTKVNDNVTEILLKYPELTDYLKFSSSGQPYFEEEDIDKILENADDVKNRSQYNLLSAKNYQQQLNNDLTRKTLVNNLRRNSYLSSDLANDYIDGKISKDEIIEIVKNNIFANRDDKKLSEDVYMRSTGGIEFQHFLENLDKINNSLVTFRKSTEQLNNSFKSTSKSIVYSEYGEDYDSASLSAMSTSYDNVYKQNLEELRNISDSWNQLSTTNEQIQELWAEYIGATGNYDFILDENAINGNDQNRKIAYKNSTGDLDFINIEEFIATIASYRALTAAGTSGQDIQAYFNTLDKTQRKGIQDYLTNGTVENLTQVELEELKDNFSSIFNDTFFNALNITSEEGKAQYQRAFENALDIDFDSIAAGMSYSARQSFEKFRDNGDLTIASQKIISNLLQNAFEVGGLQASDDLSNSIAELIKTSGKDANEVITKLSQLPSDSYSSINSFKDALAKVGINADNLSNEALQHLIDALQEVGEAASKAANHLQYNNLQKVINQVQSGNNLTQEEYDTLPEEFKSYFVETIGGTYALIEDYEKTIISLQQKSIEGYKRSVEDIQEKADILERVKSNFGENKNYENFQDYINKAPKTFDEKVDLLNLVGYDEKELRRLRTDFIYGTTEEQSKSGQEISRIYEEQKNKISNLGLDTLEIDTATIAATSNLDNYEKYINLLDDTNGELAKLAGYNELVSSGVKISKKDYDIYTKSLKDNYAELSKHPSLLQRVANANLSQQEGLKELTKNWKDYYEVLSDNNRSPEEKALTNAQVGESLNKILNIDEETWSQIDEKAEGFATTYVDEINKYIENDDLEALQILKDKVADYSLDILIDTKLNNLSDEEKEKFRTELVNFKESLKDYDGNIPIDVYLEDNGLADVYNQFTTLCQELLRAGTITSNDLSNILSNINIEPQIDWQEVEFSSYAERMGDGGDQSLSVGANVRQKIRVPVISYTAKTKDSLPSNYNNNNKSSGGKSSAPSHQKDEDSEAKRYHEQDDALDNQKELLDDLNREMDQLYGAKRLEAMRKINKETLKENELLEDKIKRAKEFYLPKDKEKVQQAAADLGVNLEFDPETMDILNYSDVMEGLYTKLNAARKGAAAENFSTKEEQDKYIEENVTPLEEQISKLEKAIDQYDQTKELLEDLQNQIEENLDKWKENNYQQLTYLLELRLDVSDADLEKITYFLDKLGDKYYSMAEAAGLMMDKLPDMQDKLGSNEDFYKQLQEDWEAGNITDAAYYEGLKSTYSNILSELTNINNLDKEMLEYYTKAVDQANSELDKFTDGFQHMASILNHYKSVLDIMGKSTDYAKVGAILEGQASNIKNELDVATENYSNWSREAKKWEEAMQSSIRGSADWELYEKNWEAAKKAMQEAQEEMLAKTEEWAQAMRDILENTMADAARKLENALTDNTSFDQLSDSIDRAKSLQEEYLTETNKIYETDKLINKAQKDIDKTTNQVHKNKLKDFIDETNQLQEQTKLSHYELEIQQAKYELLLAEIALDEARNAKSLVRLQRDSEGNYGYVYTADQDKINDAEQDYEDAQNRLYNIGLRGANEYTEKYQQTLQEMYETLKDLQDQYLNGAFESEEEYQNAVEQAKDFYYQKLKDFSYLYRIALTTDSRVQADAWGSDFEDMTQNTENWMTAVEDYLVEIEDAFAEWRNNVEEESNIVNDVLYNTKDLVGEITDESERLKDIVIDEVIPAIDDEIEKVGDATDAWAKQRNEIANLCSQYEELINTIQAAIAAQAELAQKEASSNHYGEITDFGNGAYGSAGEPVYSDGKGSISNSSGSSGYKVGDRVKLINNKLQMSSDGSIGSTTTSKWNNKEVQIDQIKTGSKYPIHIIAPGSSGKPGWIGWVSEDQLASMDTGGYTGSWGKEGRLGILHEKELVLNPEDTKNILLSIDLIRNIVKSIEARSMYSQFANIPDSSKYTQSIGNNEIEQNVHIEASFPNVTQRYEIEEAFNNLVNTASQYAYR